MQYYAVSDYSSAWARSIFNVTKGSARQAVVKELLPFTEYDCFVTANTSTGEGPPSPTQTQRTMESGQ